MLSYADPTCILGRGKDWQQEELSFSMQRGRHLAKRIGLHTQAKCVKAVGAARRAKQYKSKADIDNR